MVKLSDDYVNAPYSRECIGMTLELSNGGRGYNSLHVLDYRNQFVHACECVSGNYSGLPEPIDYFTINNNDPGVPAGERDCMPFIVCHYGETQPVNGPPYWVNTEDQLFKHLRKLAYSIGFTARVLHNDRIALRQVTLSDIRFLRTTVSYVIAEFFALCKFDKNREQFDPHRPHLRLDKRYAAPECFSEATLTPAVDVYAIAILLLQYMGARITAPITGESDVIQYLAAVEQQRRYQLRSSVVRALKMALNPDPGRRPQEFNEFINIFNDREYKQRPGNNRRPQNQRRRF